MKRATLLICCGLLAACSQTNSTADTSPQLAAAAAKPAAKGKAGTAMTAQQRCEDAMQKAAKAQTNAAMLGSALSMVGGLGGFAGRGGAVAAQAASVGGSLMQAKAQNDSEQTMQQECLG